MLSYYESIYNLENLSKMPDGDQIILADYVRFVYDLEEELEKDVELNPWDFLIEQSKEFIVAKSIRKNLASSTVKNFYGSVNRYLTYLQLKGFLPDFQFEFKYSEFFSERKGIAKRNGVVYKTVDKEKLKRAAAKNVIGLSSEEIAIITNLLANKYHPGEVARRLGSSLKIINFAVRKFTKRVLGTHMDYEVFYRILEDKKVWAPKRNNQYERLTTLYDYLNGEKSNAEKTKRTKRQGTGRAKPIVARGSGTKYPEIESHDIQVGVYFKEDHEARESISRYP